MDMKNSKLKKHGTYEQTGIMVGNLRKIYGSAGIDVNFCYIYPDGEIDVVTEGNVHYGYAHFDEDGYVVDNYDRSVFELV